MQQVAEQVELQLTANLSERIHERTRRVYKGVWISGLVFGGLTFLLNVLPSLRHAEYQEYGEYGPQGSFLLDGILESLWWTAFAVGLSVLSGRFYVRRAKVLAMTGTVITGRVVGERTSLGMNMLPTRGLGIVRWLFGLIGPAYGNILPVYTQAAEFEWAGKKRRMDIFLFKDEQPAVNEHGEVLLVVDRHSRIHPPSPFALRTRGAEDPGQLRDGAETSRPVRPSLQQVDFARRSVKKTALWIVAGCVVVYIPIFAIFGWTTLILMGLFGGIGLIAYLLRDHMDRA